MLNRCRWLLPIGHLFVDASLLVMLMVQLNAPGKSTQNRPEQPNHLRPAMLLQENAGVRFEFRWNPPPQFDMIWTGNPVAGFLSTTAKPFARWPRGQQWDPVWFLIHEAVSFPCWFLLGAWIDAGWPRLRVVMLSYIVARAVLAVAGMYEVGWRVQIVFWFALTVCLLVYGLTRLSLRVLKRT